MSPTVSRSRLLILAGIVALGGLILWSLFTVPSALALRITRGAALLGFTALFLAILSSEYQRQMRQVFGRVFQPVHHLLARVGVVLIVLHPLSYALQVGNARVFVPILTPLAALLANGGRVALYLFLLTFATAYIYRRRRRIWKPIHLLNYVAILLAVVHGLMLGDDLAGGLIRWVWLGMGAAVVAVWLHRRLVARQKR